MQEPTRREDEPDPGEEYKPGSLAIFEFTPDDLRSNQRGYLTDRQREWLRNTGRGIQSCSITSAAAATAVVLLGLAITLGLYLSNEGARRALFENPIYLTALLGSAAIGITVIGLSILLARRQAARVTEAALRSVRGSVRHERDYSPRSNITSYHVIIGDRKFSYTDDMTSVFKEGHEYTIYYCKSGPYQLIMSFEEAGK